MDNIYPNCYNGKGVMSKNIVVLSDGTGQEGGKGHDTNVYKLFRMLEDRTDKQVVFYDEGLGTDSRKISGNAQFTSKNRMFSHGTLLFDSDLDKVVRDLQRKMGRLFGGKGGGGKGGGNGKK